jgi:hypothetical protein
MGNITTIIVISLIATILIINTDYVFAKEHDLPQENKNADTSPEKDCKGSDKCTIESQQQQTNQDMSCVKSAKCINQSTSHIVICKENSMCLVQYDGPFELSNPY